MKLNYPKERWEQIPERIRSLDTTELDFTNHGERELHKMEMDRRIYITSNFLPQYSWDGSIREHRVDSDDKESEPQSNLEAFVQDV